MTEVGIVILFLVAFALGVRATFILWRMAARANPKLTEPRAYLVLVAFVVVSVVVTIAAGYFGFTLGRRLADLEPFEGQTLISIIVVAIVVLIPQFLLQIVQRIAAESDAPLIVRDEPKEEPRDGTP